MNSLIASQDFTHTRWSMVQRLRGSSLAETRRAITELAVRYWYPVYAYVRRCGHTPDISQDIAQAFLQHITDELRSGCSVPHGKFRLWLLLRLNAFLAGEWRELTDAADVDGAPPVAEMESRDRSEHVPGESAEQAFQRSFALEVLSRGLRRLRSEAIQTGHLDMCEALEPFLARDPVPGQYDDMARRLGIRTVVVVMALKRLRQRYRELVREELADIVSSPEELGAEQQVLFAALDRDR